MEESNRQRLLKAATDQIDKKFKPEEPVTWHPSGLGAVCRFIGSPPSDRFKREAFIAILDADGVLEVAAQWDRLKVG